MALSIHVIQTNPDITNTNEEFKSFIISEISLYRVHRTPRIGFESNWENDKMTSLQNYIRHSLNRGFVKSCVFSIQLSLWWSWGSVSFVILGLDCAIQRRLVDKPTASTPHTVPPFPVSPSTPRMFTRCHGDVCWRLIMKVKVTQTRALAPLTAEQNCQVGLHTDQWTLRGFSGIQVLQRDAYT